MAYKYYWNSLGAWIWGSLWGIGLLVVTMFYICPWLDEIAFPGFDDMFTGRSVGVESAEDDQ